MTATKHPQPLLAAPKKARVLRLILTINKPLTINCMDVTVKLKRALHTAQSGATAGALIVALDHQGRSELLQIKGLGKEFWTILMTSLKYSLKFASEKSDVQIKSLIPAANQMKFHSIKKLLSDAIKRQIIILTA
jgi:hypothetical protein